MPIHKVACCSRKIVEHCRRRNVLKQKRIFKLQ